jgi:flagellar biosynthesis GTPase FlhF
MELIRAEMERIAKLQMEDPEPTLQAQDDIDTLIMGVLVQLNPEVANEPDPVRLARVSITRTSIVSLSEQYIERNILPGIMNPPVKVIGPVQPTFVAPTQEFESIYAQYYQPTDVLYERMVNHAMNQLSDTYEEQEEVEQEEAEQEEAEQEEAEQEEAEQEEAEQEEAEQEEVIKVAKQISKVVSRAIIIKDLELLDDRYVELLDDRYVEKEVEQKVEHETEMDVIKVVKQMAKLEVKLGLVDDRYEGQDSDQGFEIDSLE